MTPKQAILATAELLEKQPERYSFYDWDKPKSAEDEGCILAWIGYFLNIPEEVFWLGNVALAIGIQGDPVVTETLFYNAMSSLNGGISWSRKACVASATLRKFAETMPEAA